jgi:hypothetical protein
MYISLKSNVLQSIHETEWQCRRKAKGLDKSEYWTWLATITTQDDDGHDVITYPSEDFTIVECTDEDVQARLGQLGDYVNSNRAPDEALVYNITWSDSKVSAVTGQDMEGNDITIQTHFSGNDSDKNARLLADKWKSIRLKRSRFLAETDYLAMKDQPDMSNDMQIYRKKLRDLPQDNSDPDNITWPSKPS